MSATDRDIERFSEMVRTYQAGIRAFVRSLGVHADAVDDVAQEVFVTAWRSQDTFRAEKGDFGSWLRGIVRHVVANERRKVRRRSRIMSEHLAEILDSTMGKEEEVELSTLPSLLDIMRQCLKRLPEKSHQILVQRYETEEKAPALGERLGMKAEAVRQTLLRIRRNVLKCIESKAEVLS